MLNKARMESEALNAYVTWRALCSRDTHADRVIFFIYFSS